MKLVFIREKLFKKFEQNWNWSCSHKEILKVYSCKVLLLQHNSLLLQMQKIFRVVFLLVAYWYLLERNYAEYLNLHPVATSTGVTSQLFWIIWWFRPWKVKAWPWPPGPPGTPIPHGPYRSHFISSLEHWYKLKAHTFSEWNWQLRSQNSKF